MESSEIQRIPMELNRIELRWPINSLLTPAVNPVIRPSFFLTLYWRVYGAHPRPLDVLTLFLTPAVNPVLRPSLFLTLCSTESGHTAPAQVHTCRLKGIFVRCQFPQLISMGWGPCLELLQVNILRAQIFVQDLLQVLRSPLLLHWLHSSSVIAKLS